LPYPALAPAPARVIIEELAKTDLVTVRRQDSEEDTEARAIIFAQDLAKFPPDAIRASFERHRRQSKWAPTVADIVEGCWQELRARVSLRAELRRLSAGLV
jgi:enoyl-CoA hydratase/carnithine racemase